MRRIIRPTVFLLLLGLLIAGCLREPSRDNLVVRLPHSLKEPGYNPKLTVDGMEVKGPHSNLRMLRIEPQAGNDNVSVEYSYWPNTYTNIIRTKVVPFNEGTRMRVDLTSEDLDTPDKIKPIYYPTPNAVVDAMCKLGSVGPNDVVYDIGSGDGRLVIRAVKVFGAKKGVGIELNAELVKKSWENAGKEGVAKKVEFRQGDAQEIKDLSEASVVLLYVGEALNMKLRPILQTTLKPGSRVVSHRFLMGDWRQDSSIMIQASNNSDLLETYQLHLWTIK